MTRYLVSTISKTEYPFERLSEFAENGESLEVKIEGLKSAVRKEGPTIWHRFKDFLPFNNFDLSFSLGEGSTPSFRIKATRKVCGFKLSSFEK